MLLARGKYNLAKLIEVEDVELFNFVSTIKFECKYRGLLALFRSHFFSSDGMIVDATSNSPLACGKLLLQDLACYQQS